MPDGITYLPYSDTGHFSRLVTDYIDKEPGLRDYYAFYPDSKGLCEAIEQRSKYPVDRKLLVDILRRQYEHLPKHEAVDDNLQLLESDNTFTVCTAHQPNLLTGYLYFIYKIIHAIKLAGELKQQYPDKNFVPVYYIGSEDNDLEELATFRYGDKKFVWDGGGQAGAVGRMNTAALKPLFSELFKLLGPPGEYAAELKELITEAYLHHDTIAKATQYLVNALFGRYGLLALDPDEVGFKRVIIPFLQDDLLNQSAYSIVTKQAEKLEGRYKVQANPRPINIFYLKGQLRERIERNGEKWTVVNANIEWNKDELLAELGEHPERFSPNVILRGVLQESILPNVAFIGGGAEVAYWLQLKSLFEHYQVFYPSIHLRQSVLWISAQRKKQIEQLQFSLIDIFKPGAELAGKYVARNSSNDLQTDEEDAAIEKVLARLKQKAAAIDPTLSAAADATLTKIKYQLQALEKKMLRAEKRKMQVQIDRITRMKAGLFPGGALQERVENFIEYYIKYGPQYFDTLKDAIRPLSMQFLIVEK